MRPPALLRLVVPFAVVPGLTLAVPGVASADGPETHCRIVKENAVAPGLSVQGSSGTFRTPAAGVITCEGLVNGYRPTGPGTFSETGRYGTKDPDTCLGGGEAEGRFDVAIPTEGGVQKVAREFRITYGEPSLRGGVVAGKVEGNDFHGTIDVIPVEGDCLLRPVTRIHVAQELRFFSA